MDENRITYFAETDYRNSQKKFGIKARDRTRHVYVIGKTGMGKSTLLENMAIQDIQNGEGLAVIDPHGSMAEKLLDYVPEDRIGDVIYFAPFDVDFPISFNVMEDVGADKRHLVASGLMSSFKKIWADAWSARMEYILNNTILALLEYPGATLLGVNRVLADKEFRKKVVENISDPSVKSFWVDEFAKYTERFAAEATPAIQNKVGQFTSNPLIRNIIGQAKSAFDIRKVMDERKILIINLSKGRIGEQNANLLGAMLITKIYLGAMSRADLSADQLKNHPNFYLYVDEFQSFASDSFADILSEARKYKLNLNIAHQYVEQMSEAVRAAVFGNVGTMIVFRVGSFDAQIFEKEFAPQFTADDIVNLGQYQMYLRLMIDGVGSKPFSARGMAPINMPDVSNREKIIESSRSNFARPRTSIEEGIMKWHEPIIDEKKAERIKKYAEGQEGAQKPNFERSIEERPKFNNRPERRENGPRQDNRNFGDRNPRPKPQFEKPPERQSKPSLGELLHKLSPETPKEKIEEKVEIKEEKKTISLSTLRPKEDRSASPNKLSMLKDVLNKLNKEAESKKEEPKTVEKKQEIKEEKKKGHKEVPEDVLRSILEDN